MNPEVKKKWMEALRSGKYEQGKYKLCSGNRYCCLGVLGEVMGCLVADNNLTKRVWPIMGSTSNFRDASVPDEVLDDLNLSVSNQCELMNMNDLRGMSFYEIADWIEVNL